MCLAFNASKAFKAFLIIFAGIFASLAQLVEQLIRNEQVVGSSPIGGSSAENQVIDPNHNRAALNIFCISHIFLNE